MTNSLNTSSDIKDFTRYPRLFRFGHSQLCLHYYNSNNWCNAKRLLATATGTGTGTATGTSSINKFNSSDAKPNATTDRYLFISPDYEFNRKSHVFYERTTALNHTIRQKLDSIPYSPDDARFRVETLIIRGFTISKDWPRDVIRQWQIDNIPFLRSTPEYRQQLEEIKQGKLPIEHMVPKRYSQLALRKDVPNVAKHQEQPEDVQEEAKHPETYSTFTREQLSAEIDNKKGFQFPPGRVRPSDKQLEARCPDMLKLRYPKRLGLLDDGKQQLPRKDEDIMDDILDRIWNTYREQEQWESFFLNPYKVFDVAEQSQPQGTDEAVQQVNNASSNMNKRTKPSIDKEAVEQAAIKVESHVHMIRQNENAVDSVELPDAVAEISKLQAPIDTNIDLHTADMPNVKHISDVDMVRQNENAVDSVELPDAAAEISKLQTPIQFGNSDLHTGHMPNENQTWTHNSTKKQYTQRYRPAKYPNQGHIPVAKPLIKAVSEKTVEVSADVLTNQASDMLKHDRAYGDYVTLFTGPNDEVKLQKIQQYRHICVANLQITHQRIKALVCDLETKRQRKSALNESEQQHYDTEQLILSNSLVNEKYILMLLEQNMQLLTQQTTACIKAMTSRVLKKAKSNIGA